MTGLSISLLRREYYTWVSCAVQLLSLLGDVEAQLQTLGGVEKETCEAVLTMKVLLCTTPSLSLTTTLGGSEKQEL